MEHVNLDIVATAAEEMHLVDETGANSIFGYQIDIDQADFHIDALLCDACVLCGLATAPAQNPKVDAFYNVRDAGHSVAILHLFSASFSHPFCQIGIVHPLSTPLCHLFSLE